MHSWKTEMRRENRVKGLFLNSSVRLYVNIYLRPIRGNRMQTISVDLPTKILLVVLVIVFSYLVIFLFLSTFFFRPPHSMMEMMHGMMGFHAGMMTVNLVAILLALIIGVLVSFWLTTEPTVKRADEFEILKRALSEDEKAVLEEIRRAGEITQDSLRFRLGWSKTKLSRILTNLDKMNLIQRERIGKTYNVFLTEGKA